VPERQPRCRTSPTAERIKPAEFEKAVHQLTKNESFLPVDGLPLADKRSWLSKLVEFRKVLLAAPGRQASAISAYRHIAELPWTLISGEFSSQFGQKRYSWASLCPFTLTQSSPQSTQILSILPGFSYRGLAVFDVRHEMFAEFCSASEAAAGRQAITISAARHGLYFEVCSNTPSHPGPIPRDSSESIRLSNSV
jgi:hypothetical protein